MRSDLLVFASLVALGLTIRGAMRLPVQSIPPGLLPYLGAQAIFTACAWVASQRFAYSADGYEAIYRLTAIPTLICALLFTLGAILRANAYPLMMVGAVLTLGLFDTLNREVPGIDFLKLQAAILTSCGILLLMTLARPENGLSLRIRLALGLFLAAQGFIHYGYLAGTAVERYRAVAIGFASVVPSFVALVAWSWLAIYFDGIHSELVRQNDAGNELLEARWVSLQLQELYRVATHLFR